MYKTIVKLLIIIFGLLTIGSCVKEEKLIVNGMVPIYISATDFSFIESKEPQSFNDLGNIVVYENYLFINEKGKGIHVIDNTDPSNPHTLYFWNLPGNTEFTIEDNILFADNSIHLLSIDISDFANIKVLGYAENIFLDADPLHSRPQDYKGYFYCVKKENGVHIGWKEEELIDPLCEAF